jgi:hypothetical protein
MRSPKIVTARHCRRVPACIYPAIRDGWPAGTRKQSGRAGRARMSSAIRLFVLDFCRTKLADVQAGGDGPREAILR